MRKITQEAIHAFYTETYFCKSNTKVTHTDTGTNLFLHGNNIARLHHGELSITAAGWKTDTTKERLNALINVNIRQVKGEWFLNGKPWDGSWVTV